MDYRLYFLTLEQIPHRMEDQLETLTRCTVCASLPPMRLGNVGHNIFVEERRLHNIFVEQLRLDDEVGNDILIFQKLHKNTSQTQLVGHTSNACDELYRHRDLHDMEALQCEVGRAPENDPVDTHTDVDTTHKQHKQEQTLATLTLISDNAFSENKNNNLWQKKLPHSR